MALIAQKKKVAYAGGVGDGDGVSDDGICVI